MKTTLRGWNIIWIFILASVVFNLAGRSKSLGQEILNNPTFSVETNLTDESGQEILKNRTFPVVTNLTSESVNEDFVVQFKNENVSLKKLLKLLRQHNITVPQEERFLTAVMQANLSSENSCEGRCFLEERSEAKWCYCDRTCVTWGDCCLDFQSRCGKTGSTVHDSALGNMTCGDVNDPSWTRGVIMKSSCSLPANNQNTDECQAVQQLNMTLQKEMPLFDRNNNVTYRSVACASCNHVDGNLSFWGLDMKCPSSIERLPNTVIALKNLKENAANCSWKYAPLPFLNQNFKSCVVQDSVCASNQLPVMSVIRELCSSYSMVFSVFNEFEKLVFYRNPHCALCNPEGRQQGQRNEGGGSVVPPLSLLFDVSSNILSDGKELKSSQSIFQFKDDATTGSNLRLLVYNCRSFIKNCTVTVAGKVCVLLTSPMNQTTQMFLNTSRVKILTPEQIFVKSAMQPKEFENTIFILCPDNETARYKQPSAVLSNITFAGTLLSVISLCFLLGVYLSFKELRNLPGKCLISLSCGLLCYQVMFLFVEQSKEVEALCKAVAICLHFFVLASFSWMSVIAFDTANTFKVKVRELRRQASDTRKTFIKYCINGWGVPAVAVAGCAVLDSTGTLHFGYGNYFYCWISDKRAIAAAMVTPVSLALVFNVVCLTKSLYAIHHLQQGAGLTATNASRVSLLVVCIKLTAVMGLTWILALIANWQQIAFLQYPSTVLNSMQGFFIMLCFTTTKKVRCLLKEKVCKRCNRVETPENAVPKRTKRSYTFNTTNQTGNRRKGQPTS